MRSRRVDRRLPSSAVRRSPTATACSTRLAVNALESLVDRAPILGFTPDVAQSAPLMQASLASLNAGLSGPHPPQMLLLYEANPIFSAPPALRIREALGKIPYIVSFGSFIDETSAQADLILPDHAPLESWLDSIPESGSLQAVASLAPPAVLPLHDTRSMPDVLLGLAHQLGGDLAKALPFATYDAMLRAAFVPLRTRGGSIDAKTDDDFWDAAQTQGGWWSAPSAAHSAGPSSPLAAPKHAPMAMAAPEFAGAAGDFPVLFSALRLAVVWRWFAGASALAAGAARRAHLGHVVELGGDESQDRRAFGHWSWRSGGDRVAAGKRACCRGSFPRHRTRHGGHAGRPGPREFHPLRQRPWREPALHSCAARRKQKPDRSPGPRRA